MLDRAERYFNSGANEHRVAIVVDPDFAEGIVELARSCHAWIIRSAANNPVAAALREDHPAYSLEEGVTTFGAAETPLASCLSILGTVEEHHGQYSHDPPLSVIEVIGLDPSAAVREELNAYGFEVIEPSECGFVARRDPT